MVTDAATAKRPLPLAILLVVGGFFGFLAAFELTLDKFQVLEHPASASSLSCDFSVIVQCSKNLESAEGSAFGFPNPVIGLAGYFALIVVGMTLLAGARLARWYWITLNVGVLFAMSFVIFLITKSIFHLGTLCPWCMVVWAVTIPDFPVGHLSQPGDGRHPGGPASTAILRVGAHLDPPDHARLLRRDRPHRAASARRAAVSLGPQVFPSQSIVFAQSLSIICGHPRPHPYEEAP